MIKGTVEPLGVPALGLAPLRLLQVLTKCSDAVFDAEAYPNNSRRGPRFGMVASASWGPHDAI